VGIALLGMVYAQALAQSKPFTEAIRGVFWVSLGIAVITWIATCFVPGHMLPAKQRT